MSVPLQKLFRLFGSAKLAVALLAVLAMAMLAGTVLESLFNAAMARACVFRASWFLLLLSLIGLSLLVSLLDRLPYQPRLLGFYIVHVALILLFCASIWSSLTGVTGVIALKPGRLESQVKLDGEPVPLRLPFSLELIDFQIERAPHSRREVDYRAQVKVHPSGSVHEVRMNQPLDVGGFRFYQTSYFKLVNGRRDPARTPELGTLFSVNKDPARWAKYASSALFLLGALIHLKVREPRRKDEVA